MNISTRGPGLPADSQQLAPPSGGELLPRASAAAFFAAFVEAFATLDGARIAQRFATPYLALDAQGRARCWSEPRSVSAYFQEVVDGYRAQGCSACRFLDLETVPLGPGGMLASVTWELLRESGEVVSRWRESYLLARVADGWRVGASLDHATWIERLRARSAARRVCRYPSPQPRVGPARREGAALWQGQSAVFQGGRDDDCSFLRRSAGLVVFAVERSGGAGPGGAGRSKPG